MPPAPRRPIRVAIANDYPLVVEGLCRIFEPYPARVTLTELIVASDRIVEPVDVILFDVFASDRRAPHFPKALNPAPQGTKLILFGWSGDAGLIDPNLHGGVHGYIQKSLPPARIIAAIEKIVKGERVVAMTEAHPHAPRPVVGDWPGRAQRLTVRESEVIALVTQGMANVDIAKALFLSPNSIKTIIRSAYKKMDVTRRGEAVAWGASHGFRPDLLPQRYRVVYSDDQEGKML